MTKFSLGQVVQLKSDGPKMVVGHLAPRGEVICFWHRTDGSATSYEFSAFMLEDSEGQKGEVKEKEILITEEMADAGLEVWHTVVGIGIRETIRAIYRAMRAVEPK